jgi:RNA polymerase sigma-70 factor, ECF subfamily
MVRSAIRPSQTPKPPMPVDRLWRTVAAESKADGSAAAVTEGETEGDSVDDAALLRAHVNGDPDAFALLVARHKDRMWAVALRIMRDPEDAADALQDAYIAAFRRAASFRGESQVTSWLHRVVVNACLDRLRSMRLRETKPLPDNLDRSRRMGVITKDPVEIKEQRSVVGAALGTLNADQRAALVLVDMEGYSVEEAAQILGCAPGTVKSRCARGRARLLPLLSHLEQADAES